jgi:hypothetical protein
MEICFQYNTHISVAQNALNGGSSLSIPQSTKAVHLTSGKKVAE